MKQLFFGAVMIGSYISILSSLICIIISRSGKNKESIRASVLWLLSAIFVLLLLYLFGQFWN